jgi:hypothetical protein
VDGILDLSTASDYGWEVTADKEFNL